MNIDERIKELRSWPAYHLMDAGTDTLLAHGLAIADEVERLRKENDELKMSVEWYIKQRQFRRTRADRDGHENWRLWCEG